MRGLSIQTVVEAAAANLNGGHPVTSVAAGRTDAGVHAAGQVAHLDLPRPISPAQLRDALNFHLKPHPVVVLAVAEVAPDWSARFSASGRAYRYRILNRPARAALAAGQAWHQSHPLDADAMGQAARRLLGRHDFTSFRATACQARSPVRTLDRLDVAREGETITISAEARSFLHHQVRTIVGTLRLVGESRWTAEDVTAALAARRRSAAGPTAPAHGLCLMRVVYGDDVFRER